MEKSITNDFKLTPRNATLKDVASKANVDVSTASRALADSYGVHPKTRQKVLAVAQRLNYRPNPAARSLVTGKSRTFGLLISDVRNPFFAELARGAEDAAYAAGYDVILCNSDLDPDKQWAYLNSLREKRVAGILMNTVLNLSEEQKTLLTDYHIPVVLLNQQSADSPFSALSADNVAGGELAASYLIALGHRKIAHFTGSRNNGNLSDRCRGFLRICRLSAFGVNAVVLHGNHSSDGGYEMTGKLLSEHHDVTAIFAGNDMIAFGVLRALSERGVSVPNDISLLGFDNVEVSGIINPPLTTIDQPKYELGQVAVKILLRQADASGDLLPVQRSFPVKLVERKSCQARVTK